MTDQELAAAAIARAAGDRWLIAAARRTGLELRRRPGDLDRLAGALLAELADRLDGRAAALEAALGFHGEHRGHCDGCSDAYGEPVEWPCDEFRAITAAQATEGSNG